MTHMDQELHETYDEGHHDKPLAPIAGIVYGDLVYWITIAATFMVLAGSIITFVTTNNYIDPSYMLSAIWEGKTVEEIWQGATGAQPDGHWYLPHLTTGNGMTAGGIALGVFSVIPAIIASAIVLFRQKERLFGVLAVIAAVITTLAIAG
ncbi:hypothetical protein [Kaarinaea lacus]